MSGDRVNWWERPWLPVLLALLALVPLLGPDVPPLVDLPGHMARYKIQLDYERSAALRDFYAFNPWPIGNLGIDILVIPLARLIGFEPAVKAIVAAIPALMVIGFLWTARELHGRVPPTALFALPLAYCFPFNFGFVNFALSIAFAFLGFALWLRLGRLGRLRLRAWLFVPVACLVWLCHAFGWAALSVLGFTAEVVARKDQGADWKEALFRGGLACWSLATPILPMIVWRSGPVEGETLGWNPVDKVNYLITVFRDRWRWFDLGSLALCWGVVALALFGRRLGFDRRLGVAAILFAIFYLLLPRQLFGSAYADLRLVPFLLASALLAIRPTEAAGRGFVSALAVAGLLFVVVRFAAITESLRRYDKVYDSELAALDRLPRGARLVTFVGTSCRDRWTMTRLDHIPGMAVVRRDAFSNEQWSLPGAQLVQARMEEAGKYRKDPSQIVRLTDCAVNRWPTLDERLSEFPRAAFDYLWVVNPPDYDRRLVDGLEPVWTNGRSVLFRIPHVSPSS